MTAVDYTEEHYEEVAEWFKARCLEPLPATAFPQIGKIVPGIAAIWLYQTDSDTAFLENAISNPAADRSVSSQALDIAIAGCLLAARELGFRGVAASTNIEKVKERSKRHGFVEIDQGHTIIWRQLWEN